MLDLVVWPWRARLSTSPVSTWCVTPVFSQYTLVGVQCRHGALHWTFASVEVAGPDKRSIHVLYSCNCFHAVLLSVRKEKKEKLKDQKIVSKNDRLYDYSRVIHIEYHFDLTEIFRT